MSSPRHRNRFSAPACFASCSTGARADARDGRFRDLSATSPGSPTGPHGQEVFVCETVTVPFPEVTDPGTGDGWVLAGGLRAARTRIREQATTYLARDRALQRLVVLQALSWGGVSQAGARRCSTRAARWRGCTPVRAPCLGVETRGDEIDLVVEYVPGRPLAELAAKIEPAAGGAA